MPEMNSWLSSMSHLDRSWLTNDIERLYGDLDNEDSISVNSSEFWVLFVL